MSTPVQRGAQSLDPDAFNDSGAYAPGAKEQSAEFALESAQEVLEAALCDPDNPDWLAKVLFRHRYRKNPEEMPTWEELPQSHRDAYRTASFAVQLAILGE